MADNLNHAVKESRKCFIMVNSETCRGWYFDPLIWWELLFFAKLSDGTSPFPELNLIRFRLQLKLFKRIYCFITSSSRREIPQNAPLSKRDDLVECNPVGNWLTVACIFCLLLCKVPQAGSETILEQKWDHTQWYHARVKA